MTQLEKSVFGAGFVAMTEDELYEVNGGRIGGRRENGWHHPREEDGGSCGGGSVVTKDDNSLAGGREISKVTVTKTTSEDKYMKVDADGSTTIGVKTENTVIVEIDFKEPK